MRENDKDVKKVRLRDLDPNIGLKLDDNDYITEGIFQSLHFDDSIETEDKSFTQKDKLFCKVLRVIPLLAGILGMIWFIIFKIRGISGIPGLLAFMSYYIMAYAIGRFCEVIIDNIVYNHYLDNSKYCRAVPLVIRGTGPRAITYYAYQDGLEVKVTRSQAIDGDKKDRGCVSLGKETKIWLNPHRPMICFRGDDEGAYCQKKQKLKTRAVALFLIFTIVLFPGSLWYKEYSEPKADPEYADILIEYEENPIITEYTSKELGNPEYQWAARTTSLYAFLEYGDSQYVGGHEIKDRDIDEWKEYLDTYWKISDRNSAQNKIDSVIKYGHRSEFEKSVKSDKEVQKAIEVIRRDYGDELSFEDTFNITEEYFEENGISTENFFQIKGSACAYLRFGEEGLVGYDFLRLSRITYLCYRCGYLSLDECMMLLEHYNEKLKRTYTCYEDIHESYYYGEMFRLREVTDRSTEITTNIKDEIVKAKEDGFYEGINKVF